jgi:OFA family oxalate/formate antiporter-like MFS transporter
MQVMAQAAGPLLSGALRDWTGTYSLSLTVFAGVAGLAALAALMAQRPHAAP